MASRAMRLRWDAVVRWSGVSGQACPGVLQTETLAGESQRMASAVGEFHCDSKALTLSGVTERPAGFRDMGGSG